MAMTSTPPPSPFLSQFLSSTLHVPSLPQTHQQPGERRLLLSNRDPLSIPTTTAHFRRFVAKIGPVFWLQDRIEEIVLWKTGWKPTTLWMAIYAFFCCFPRLLLLVPLLLILIVMISTYPKNSTDKPPTTPLPSIVEGSVPWQANLQAIQNLMGAYSDLYDVVVPFIPHVTHGTPTTAPLLTVTLFAIVALIPLLHLVPLRPIILFLGLAPFVFTHPHIRALLPRLRETIAPYKRRLLPKLTRILDDDRLLDRHWRSEMRTVEIWENERFSSPSPVSADGGGWGKSSLRPGERVAWTRGRDGWSGVLPDGQVSNLTFPLPAGWHFVETEDWRPDIAGSWIAPIACDDNGWVYTNDAWLDARSTPADEWKTRGATRRRRWLRRIYYHPDVPQPEKI